jgi:uroporphyrinogen-III synthase
LRVWVTRARPGAERTAERLRELGHAPLIDPVLEVRPIEGALDLDGIAALAFTSRNGVDAFAGRDARRALPVFAVGDGTAETARAAGFTRVESAHGDVAALAGLIAARAASLDGAVLHAAAKERAADLEAMLRAAGVPARTAVVYETVARDPAEALVRLPEIDAVLVHSPKAARRLAELVAPEADGPVFACMSSKCAAPLIAAGFQKVRSAPFPDEAGLLKVLGTIDHVQGPA